MVWVLTLSFRFIRVICPGLTPYFLISAYCDTPFSFMVAQSFSYEIITRKPPRFFGVGDGVLPWSAAKQMPLGCDVPFVLSLL